MSKATDGLDWEAYLSTFTTGKPVVRVGEDRLRVAAINRACLLADLEKIKPKKVKKKAWHPAAGGGAAENGILSHWYSMTYEFKMKQVACHYLSICYLAI